MDEIHVHKTKKSICHTSLNHPVDAGTDCIEPPSGFVIKPYFQTSYSLLYSMYGEHC